MTAYRAALCRRLYRARKFQSSFPGDGKNVRISRNYLLTNTNTNPNAAFVIRGRTFEAYPEFLSLTLHPFRNIDCAKFYCCVASYDFMNSVLIAVHFLVLVVEMSLLGPATCVVFRSIFSLSGLPVTKMIFRDHSRSLVMALFDTTYDFLLVFHSNFVHFVLSPR